MPTDRHQLRLFEGHDVEGATYRLTGGCDVDLPGLEWHGKVVLLIEAECDEVTFKALSKDDPDLLQRQHTLKTVRSIVYPDEFEARRMLEGLAPAVPPGDAR
jgi:hypothetical protein